MKFNTKTIHGGQIKEKAYGAVMPPIYQTSTYSQKSPGEHSGYEYSRTQNPTRHALERSIASLENAKYGLAFSGQETNHIIREDHDFLLDGVITEKKFFNFKGIRN